MGIALVVRSEIRLPGRRPPVEYEALYEVGA
jgi:hypothetical protein